MNKFEEYFYGAFGVLAIISVCLVFIDFSADGKRKDACMDKGYTYIDKQCLNV